MVSRDAESSERSAGGEQSPALRSEDSASRLTKSLLRADAVQLRLRTQIQAAIDNHRRSAEIQPTMTGQHISANNFVFRARLQYHRLAIVQEKQQLALYADG